MRRLAPIGVHPIFRYYITLERSGTLVPKPGWEAQWHFPRMSSSHPTPWCQIQEARSRSHPPHKLQVCPEIFQYKVSEIKWDSKAAGPTMKQTAKSCEYIEMKNAQFIQHPWVPRLHSPSCGLHTAGPHIASTISRLCENSPPQVRMDRDLITSKKKKSDPFYIWWAHLLSFFQNSQEIIVLIIIAVSIQTKP